MRKPEPSKPAPETRGEGGQKEEEGGEKKTQKEISSEEQGDGEEEIE